MWLWQIRKLRENAYAADHYDTSDPKHSTVDLTVFGFETAQAAGNWIAQFLMDRDERSTQREIEAKERTRAHELALLRAITQSNPQGKPS